jgi:diguanylate cyclase (GGDEF)-like protein
MEDMDTREQPMDTRIPSYRAAVQAMAKGVFDTHILTTPLDDVGQLGEGLLELASALKRRFDEVDLLIRITEKINAGVLLEDVLNYVYDLCRQLLPYDRMGFALIEGDGRLLRLIWARTEASRQGIPKDYEAPLSGSSLQGILATHAPRIINDLEGYYRDHPQSDSTRRMLAEGIRSSLTCPLIAIGKPIGFIFFSSMKPNGYAERHIDVFSRIAGHLALIVEKARLYEDVLKARLQLEESNRALDWLASNDALTGLHNRRYFDEVFQLEWRRMHRAGAPIALIMADLDGFKALNDQHGHFVGDECLKRVGHAMQGALPRATDFAARYGGDEFVFVLPATDVNGARHVAELLRQAVGRMRADLPETSPASHLTVSLGVSAVRPARDGRAESLMQLADRALYQAKQAGRDCVVVLTEPSAPAGGISISGY